MRSSFLGWNIENQDHVSPTLPSRHQPKRRLPRFRATSSSLRWKSEADILSWMPNSQSWCVLMCSLFGFSVRKASDSQWFPCGSQIFSIYTFLEKASPHSVVGSERVQHKFSKILGTIVRKLGFEALWWHDSVFLLKGSPMNGDSQWVSQTSIEYHIDIGHK